MNKTGKIEYSPDYKSSRNYHSEVFRAADGGNGIRLWPNVTFKELAALRKIAQVARKHFTYITDGKDADQAEFCSQCGLYLTCSQFFTPLLNGTLEDLDYVRIEEE